MYFSIIKNIAIVLFLTAFPVSAFAAGLGSANVTSALGEPLNASIELLSMTPAEITSLQAKIDSEAAYVEQGLTRLAIHDEIKLRLIKQAGSNILKLTSNSAIADPVLDLLVVVEWSNGRISRQYTLLLDPPSYQPNTNQAQVKASNQLDNTSIKKVIPDLVKAPNSTATGQAATSPPQEHLTKKGDTLFNIARRMQPTGVDLDKVLVALFEANPTAFDGKNMNRLKVGKILQAPSSDTINAITDQHVNDEIKLQTADWNQYRNKLAEAIARDTAQVNTEDAQSNSGKINSAAEDKSAPINNPKDVVKLSTADKGETSANTQAKLTALQEEVSAREKGLKEAEERTVALEKQIEDMQKLLALKNNPMLNAQEQSAQSQVVEEAESKSEETNQSALNAEADNQESAKPQDSIEQTIEVPSQTVATSELEQTSLIDTTLNKLRNLNKTILLAIVGILVLLIAIWLFLRNKRSKQLHDFEQGIMTSGSLKANTVFGNSASGSVATGDTSFLTDFSHSSSNGLIDTNDVDPIAEAEVYMAYGRDAQAEEILKDAISKEPERYELHHKLLEMYASNKNVAAFEMVAGEIFTALGANNPIWMKVAEMGAKLEPANPLYQLNETVIAKPAEAIQPELSASEQDMVKKSEAELAMVEEKMAEPDFVITQSSEPELVKFEPENFKPEKFESISIDVTDNELEASDFSDSPLASEVDLDFSIADNTDASNALVAGDDDLPTEISFQRVDEMIEADFDQHDQDLQFDLDGLDESPEVAKALSDMPSLDFPPFPTEQSLELKEAHSDVESEVPTEAILDTPITKDIATNNISSADIENSGLENFDFGLEDEDNNIVFDAKNANILDVSGISLDISDEISTVIDAEVEPEVIEERDFEEPMTPAYEEVETKLELVAAYIDMEDKDGAKELLEEVLKEGNASQCKRANQILVSLA